MTTSQVGNSDCGRTNGNADGAYAGGGAHLQISFSVAGSGSELCGLHGNVLIACASATSSADSLQGYADPNTISVSSATFSDQYKLGNGTVNVSGSLDGSGHASGTFSFAEPYCTSGTIPWQAAIGGTSPASTAPTTTAAQCSPQPCGTLDGLTATITGVTPATVSSSTSGQTGAAALVVNVTMANGTSSAVTFNPNSLALRPGSGASFVDTLVTSATSSAGGTVACSHGPTNIDPGQSAPLSACFEEVNPVPSGTPLGLDWTSSVGRPPVVIDLGQAP